jgi:hypothetical protein
MRPHSATAPALGLLVLASCGPTQRTIQIPDSVVANPKKGQKDHATIQPYVVKVSDGKRIWEVHIPRDDGSGSFMIPLKLDEAELDKAAGETAADREIRDEAPIPPDKIEAPAVKTAGKKDVKDGAAKDSAEPARSRSYLGTLAKVNGLFRKKEYYLGFKLIVDLEKEYPDDERILEMKGTLAWKLKNKKLARESWERVLQLNPNNTAVAQAIESLLGE